MQYKILLILLMMLSFCLPLIKCAAQEDLSLEPITFQRYATSYLSSYIQDGNGTHVQANHVLQLWLGEKVVACAFTWQAHAMLTGSVRVYYAVRLQPAGENIYEWSETYNVTFGQNYLVTVAMPKPVPGAQVYVKIYSPAMMIGLSTPSETKTVLYNGEGDVVVGAAAYTLYYYPFPSANLFSSIEYGRFRPAASNSTHAILEYVNKTGEAYELLRVTGKGNFSLSSNYIVYNESMSEYFVPLPAYYGMGAGIPKLTFSRVWAALPYGEDSLTPLYAPASFYSSGYNSTWFMLATSSGIPSNVTGNLYGAIRRVNFTSNVVKVYFPEHAAAAYTIQCDFGERYVLSDTGGRVLDFGRVSNTSKTFVVTLEVGKTYAIKIDSNYVFLVGADNNYVKGLFIWNWTPKPGPSITFYAVRNKTHGMVVFSDPYYTSSFSLMPVFPAYIPGYAVTIDILLWNATTQSYHVLYSGIFESSPVVIYVSNLHPGMEYFARVSSYANDGYPFGAYYSITPFVYTGLGPHEGVLGYVHVAGAAVPVVYFVFTTFCVALAALFSETNAEIGAFIVCIVYFFFSLFNLVPSTVSLVNILYAVILAAVLEMFSKRRRSGA
ncbi:MAG: hypothetical protein QW175_06270 [Candidatus Bathyarchaeia archaeon]